MLFNSFVFLIFLPTMLVLYYCSPYRLRQLFLVVGSYFFYCFAVPAYGLLLLFSTVLDFGVGLGLGRTDHKRWRKILLCSSLVGNLGVLAFFKYADFMGMSWTHFLTLFGSEQSWTSLGFILPIGISFYTFQTMSYTIEVYRGRLKPTTDFLSFALYVSFFPQLVAGPIERAPNLLPQLQQLPNAQHDDIYFAVRRILWGFFKKIVIADRLAFLVDYVYGHPAEEFSTHIIWLATYAFAFQIYFDFSGYSDIAIGTARLFGIRLMENFKLPYYAPNISEFWHRWHISFSTWLRDYLYIPLGGSRKSMPRTLFNVSIVMFLGGLWHGAAWNFVIWGLYQGFLLVLYHGWKSMLGRTGRPPRGGSRKSLSILKQVGSTLITFHATCIGWVFFRASSLADAGALLKRMLFEWDWVTTADIQGTSLFFGAILMLYFFHVVREKMKPSGHFERVHPLVTGLWYGLMILFILFGGVSTSQKFIYFQF